MADDLNLKWFTQSLVHNSYFLIKERGSDPMDSMIPGQFQDMMMSNQGTCVLTLEEVIQTHSVSLFMC